MSWQCSIFKYIVHTLWLWINSLLVCDVVQWIWKCTRKWDRKKYRISNSDRSIIKFQLSGRFFGAPWSLSGKLARSRLLYYLEKNIFRYSILKKKIIRWNFFSLQKRKRILNFQFFPFQLHKWIFLELVEVF